MSSSVAAGMLSLLAEMNWMRASSRETGAVAVVGDDDADGQEAVLDVGQAEEGAVSGVVAGLGGDGDVLAGMGVVGGVLGGGLGREACGSVAGGAGGEAEAGRL